MNIQLNMTTQNCVCVCGVKSRVNVVSAEWFALGPDFGNAPDVNTEQYWAMAFYGSFMFF